MECEINVFLLVCVKVPPNEMVSLIRLINSYLLINDVCVRRARAYMLASVSVCVRSSVCVYTRMLLNVYY